MSRKRKSLPILENVEIESVAAEGKCVAHVNDMVVFVPFVVPGDIVDLQVRKKRHSYCEATVLRMIQPSPMRITPKCEHFGVCGGCKWQNLPYKEQLVSKQQQVLDQLKRIGKVELPMISYPINKCVLMDNYCNKVRNAIYNYAVEHKLSFYDIREQHGLLRDIMMRNSNTGEWLVLVQFHYDEVGDEECAMNLMQFIADEFPEITSLLYVDNQKGNDTFNDLELTVFKGNDHIFELMEDLRFKVGAKSFYQTNTDQAYHLYSVARNFANLTGNELVYDLYTGTGTIANFVAKKAKKVIGIEYVPEAIEDAKINSEINEISNTLFYAGDMKDILTEAFVKQHGRPDVIITDPPRAGMHADVVNVILGAHPKRIVYVSCNPATQARDLALLDRDYKVVAVQPVDMFPHTPHVENVVLLETK